jgi:hypothetical protein
MYGTVDTACWPSRDETPDTEIDLRLPDGQHVTVPADVLIEQGDGSFYVPLHQRAIDRLTHRDAPAPGTDDCWPCARQRREKELMRGAAQ